MEYIKNFFCAYSCTDETIKEYMKYSDDDAGYNGSIDPHTATAAFAADRYVSDNKKDFDGIKNPLFCPIYILGTADPCKFPETINKAIGLKPNLPNELDYIISAKENYDIIPNNLDKVKNYILEKN